LYKGEIYYKKNKLNKKQSKNIRISLLKFNNLLILTFLDCFLFSFAFYNKFHFWDLHFQIYLTVTVINCYIIQKKTSFYSVFDNYCYPYNNANHMLLTSDLNSFGRDCAKIFINDFGFYPKECWIWFQLIYPKGVRGRRGRDRMVVRFTTRKRHFILSSIILATRTIMQIMCYWPQIWTHSVEIVCMLRYSLLFIYLIFTYIRIFLENWK
jgi:hypothetical protein